MAICSAADAVVFCIGRGVTAICIGIDTAADGVEGGILFSTSTKESAFEGVLNGVLLLLVRVFGSIMSLCFRFRSLRMFVALDFDESVEEMGEKGFRVMGDSVS